jgi:hypothetical protein
MTAVPHPGQNCSPAWRIAPQELQGMMNVSKLAANVSVHETPVNEVSEVGLIG